MKINTKTKLTTTVVAILLLATIFGLKYFKNKNNSSLLPNKEIEINSDETLKKEIPLPLIESTITNKTELAKKAQSLTANARSSNSNELSTGIDVDMDNLEKLIVNEIGDEVRTQLGKHAFEKEIIKMTNPPESVLIKIKPVVGSMQKYETFTKLCDKEGNISEDDMATTSSDGIRKYEIIDINENNGTYTVREWVEGEVVKARKNFNLFVEKIPPIFEKTFKYGIDGTVLKVEQSGRDITSLYKNVPSLVFPQKELHVGDSWTCGGDEDSTWKIDANISGFAQVSGQPCVIISFDETQRLSIPGVKVSFVQRTGKKYYDLDRHMLIRSEYVETTDGKFGPLDKISYLVVRDIVKN